MISGLPLVLLLAAFPLAAAPIESWPAPQSLAARSDLPDPLILRSGRTVKTVREWERLRRPELKAMFSHYMYGEIAPRPAQLRFRTVGTHPDFLNGLGTLKLVQIECGGPGAPVIDLMLVVPNRARGRVPAFLAMNFCGNHAITFDRHVPLAHGSMIKFCAGCVDGKATDAGRGGQQADWPIAGILHRGYALATFCSSDIDPDLTEASTGLAAWRAQTDPRIVTGRDRGTIAAWAWGFSRAMDYLVTDRSLDPKRVAAVGHSRNGKTALLAAAFDDRFAMAIPHQAGCGGTAPSRGHVGESVERINTSFPHWFNAEFKKFNAQPERLPFDQHCLMALMAPRPVLLSNAEEDQWANPAGQFEVLKAAEPVYRLLGAGGVDARQMPASGVLLKSRLGYYIRPGKHSMTAGDWQVFLDFADAHLPTTRK